MSINDEEATFVRTSEILAAALEFGDDDVAAVKIEDILVDPAILLTCPVETWPFCGVNIIREVDKGE